MQPRPLLASLALAPAALVLGCGTEDPPEDDIASTEQALSTPVYEMPQNGYPPGGLAANAPLLETVWKHTLDDAGFALTLSTGSISSLFDPGNPANAKQLMDYLVSCALDSGKSVTAAIGNTQFTWKGQFGLCDTGSPFGNWRTPPSGASPACRYMVSSCILARMNALDRHVPISIRVPDRVGANPVDARKFRPVAGVRVQSTDRHGTTVASDWQPDFVGICTRGTTVTLQRTAATGMAVRVCTGIHACKEGPPELIVYSSPPRIYSGFLREFAPGDAISFTCPVEPSTAPNGNPELAYFSILVSPGTGGALSPSPMLEPFFNPTTAYPAPERSVFTYLEGAFYGDLLTETAATADRNACYSSNWQEGPAYESYRICANTAPETCFIESGPCDRDCAGRSPGPDEAFYDCVSADSGNYRWTGVTVFLNDPSAIADHPKASQIQSGHDVCTPGALLVNDMANPIVTSICAQDPYCCSVAWDSRCTSEVRTVANSQQCLCSHPVCTTGAKLNNGCSPVVTSVCAADPYCCNIAWDGLCVGEVQTIAHSQECLCSHSVCDPGGALTNGCRAVVTSVCAADPYCCNIAWDSRCVDEVQTVASSPECI